MQVIFADEYIVCAKQNIDKRNQHKELTPKLHKKKKPFSEQNKNKNEKSCIDSEIVFNITRI